jgi:eukaryotic-like serine/threonine-protein kinase
MGEVYRAKDVKLDRMVAIKVLPQELSADVVRLRRFEQEARAASALNHPNIVTVYGVGESDSVSYMATELVEGRTLAETLLHGCLPTKQVLDLGAQIAEGLAAAHEAGIVHRDLKPANVMVTKTGLVKILDFGLAKRPVSLGVTESTVTTMDAPRTEPGEVMGTAGYMSPEQARGEEIDSRSDQFSLGSVLYELATGRRAFKGRTPMDTLAAVLNEEPEPIARIQPGVPAPLRWTIERCLTKLPAERYQSTRDLAHELRGMREHITEVSESVVAQQPAPRRRRLLLAAAFAGAIVVGGALWAMLGGSRSIRAGPEFRRLTFRSGVVTRALFMQKSNSILYTASWDGQAPRTYLTLPESKGADRSLEAETQLPMAFSEDGSEVLALLGLSRPAINSVGTLAWWPALGGKARPFLEKSGWADWAKKGQFLADVQDEGSMRVLQVRDSTGKLRQTLFRTAGAIAYVSISPDEKEVAFIHHPSRIDDAGEIRIVSVDGARQRALTPLFERCGGLKWNPRTGEVWFTASRTEIYSTALWGVDREGRLRMVHSFPDFFLLQDIGDGGALFVASSEDTSLLLKRGDEAPTDFSWLGSTYVCDISPDGRSILFIDGRAPSAGTLGAWVRPLDGSEAIRIADGNPGKFSPDGRWVVFTSRPVTGPPQLALVPAGGGKALALTSSPTAAYSKPSFAGNDMLLFIRSEGERREVWRMKVDGTRAEALGVTGCDDPVANPSATHFLCFEEPDDGALVLHGFTPREAGRRLFALPAGETFLYARWNVLGDRIFAVTDKRRFLTLDSSTGAVLREQKVPLRQGIASEFLLGAACSPDGETQAYSISSTSSRLYLGRGMS